MAPRDLGGNVSPCKWSGGRFEELRREEPGRGPVQRFVSAPDPGPTEGEAPRRPAGA